MNFEVLLGSIFAVLGTSTVVALKSYKNAPEPVNSSYNYDSSRNSESPNNTSPSDLELIVPQNPVLEEVGS